MKTTYTTIMMIIFIATFADHTYARPTQLEDLPSRDLSASRRISSGSPYQHFRSTVKRRYVETQVATKLAKELALKQRMQFLTNLLDKVHSGPFSNIQMTPLKVSDSEASRFMRNHVESDIPGFEIEVREIGSPIYVSGDPSTASRPPSTSYQEQLKVAIAKAKLCYQLQMALLSMKSRTKVQC